MRIAKIAARPKVNRDLSVKAGISIFQPVNSGELEKKKVRNSSEAIAYYTNLKNIHKITLDRKLLIPKVSNIQNLRG
jgi:hypothetical protein